MEFKNLPIDEEIKRFHKHLSQENNKRIIISGIFGIGKTHFINNFFKVKKEEFIEIRINPVNYSVSANEDIFELIKFDIGYKLFKEKPDFEKVVLKNSLATEFFFLNNYKSLIEKLTINLSKLDQELSFVVKPIMELRNKILEFKKKNEIDDKSDLNIFLEEFKLKEGTAREENSLTVLITFLLQTLKYNYPDKKTVLVIDDLDRIDPEHIFRILNIFSAHFDYYEIEGENKFGFDKIVLICDIDNIRGIFHNRYGTDIDFSGYIDKFYSVEIFEYQFSSVIVASLEKFYKSISSENSTIKNNITSNGQNYYTKELTFILEYLIESNSLSMRSLINFLRNSYTPLDLTIKTRNSYKVYTNATPIFLIFDILSKIFGGKESVLIAIDKTIRKFPVIEMSPYNDYWNRRLGNLVMILDNNENYLLPTNEEKEFLSNDFNIKVIYHIESMDYGIQGDALKIGLFDSKESYIDVNHTNNYKIQYFQILKQAFIVFNQIPKYK